jgi:hypothetical protein
MIMLEDCPSFAKKAKVETGLGAVPNVAPPTLDLRKRFAHYPHP